MDKNNIKLDNVDVMVFELIKKDALTPTQIARMLGKKQTNGISRSLRKLRILKIAETFKGKDKRKLLYVGASNVNIDKYKI